MVVTEGYEMAVVARYTNGIERTLECIAARFQRPEPRPDGHWTICGARSAR